MPKSEESIIHTMRKMVSEGESEEKITRTLLELGVSEAQAKRLLLLAQAETFALLKKEIESIVEEKLRKEMPQHIKALSVEAREAGKLNQEVIVQDIQRRFQKVANLEGFEEDIKSKVRSAIDSSAIARQKIANIEKALPRIEEDVEMIKARGTGARSKAFSILLLTTGMALSAGAIFLAFVSSQQGTTTQNIFPTALLATIGIAGMFLSSRV